MAKKAAAKSKSSKVLEGSKGKLGSLTFGDIGKLAKALKGFKGELPKGFTRRGGQFCVTKKP